MLVGITVALLVGGCNGSGKAKEKLGPITTVAGNGEEIENGGVGDSGPATAAFGCEPTDVALDADGNPTSSSTGSAARQNRAAFARSTGTV